MPVQGKITVDTEVRSAGFTKGLGEVGMGLKKFVGDAERDFHKFTGLFAGIKDSLRSPLSSNWGTPIAAGVGLMGKYATGALDIATALRTGESVAKVFGETVNKIPIVGQFKQAGEAIRELFTGEQAARIEREKSAEALQRSVNAYREMALQAALLGKYGSQRAKQEAENATNNEITELRDKHAAIQVEISRAEELFANRKGGKAEFDRSKLLAETEFGGTGLPGPRGPAASVTAAEQAELDRMKKEEGELQAKMDAARAKGKQAQADLDEAINRAQQEDIRRTALQTDEILAGINEKRLRREGKSTESAVEGIRQTIKSQVSEIDALLTTYALKMHGFRSDSERDAYVKSKQDQRAALIAGGDEGIQELQATHARKLAEAEKDSEEKRTEILADAGIDRLRLIDEQANALNERRGVAARSHLAEAAQIEEQYRKQLEEAQKAHRDDDERRNDANDPLLKGDLDAANKKRLAALGLLDAKSAIETQKNQQSHLKEMRKLWEEVGEPADKYKARLADINEEFQKYGDKKLRARQIEKLDAATFDELKKLNPDHDPKVELYGRTLSYAGIPSGDRSSDIANKQLDELKKQNAANEDRRTLLQKLVDYFTGPVSEVNI